MARYLKRPDKVQGLQDPCRGQKEGSSGLPIEWLSNFLPCSVLACISNMIGAKLWPQSLKSASMFEFMASRFGLSKDSRSPAIMYFWSAKLSQGQKNGTCFSTARSYTSLWNGIEMTQQLMILFSTSCTVAPMSRIFGFIVSSWLIFWPPNSPSGPCNGARS